LVTERQDAIRVFISYARLDAAVADRLVADLEARGITVMIDRRDLPFGEEWEKELAGFIRDSDTVLWLVSHASVASRWCNWELGEVQRTSKRLVPLRIEPVPPDALPDALGRLHLLPAEGTFDPALHLDALIETLEADLPWIKDHTRLAGDAAEWTRNGRSSDLLLRGRGLTDAEAWRDRRPASAPPAGADTLDLILQSRRGATRRLRLLGLVATSVAIVLAVLALVAVSQRNVADDARAVAETERARAEQEQSRAEAALVETEAARQLAEQQRQLAESQRLRAEQETARAEQETKRAEFAAETATLQRESAIARVETLDAPLAGLKRATAAAKRNVVAAGNNTIPVLADIYAGLFDALASARELPSDFSDVLGVGGVTAMAQSSSADGRSRWLIASDEKVVLLDDDGKMVSPPIIAADLDPLYANAAIWETLSNTPWLAIATGSRSGLEVLNPGVSIYDFDGKQIASLFTDNAAPFVTLDDIWHGGKLLAGDANGSIFVIDTKTWTGQKILQGSGIPVVGFYSELFSEPQMLVAYGPAPSPSAEGPPPAPVDVGALQAALALALGEPQLVVQTLGGATGIDSHNCLLDLGQLSKTWGALTCDSRGGVSLWRGWNDGAPPAPVLVSRFAAEINASAVAYNAELDAVAIGSSNGSMQVWSINGQPLTPVLRDPSGRPIKALAFSADGSRLLSAAGDGIGIREWDLSELIWPAETATDISPQRVAVTADGDKRVAVEDSFGKDVSILAWSRKDTWKYEGALPDDSGQFIAISEDGSRIAWNEPGAIVVADTRSGNPVRFAIDAGAIPVLLALSRDGHSLFASTIPSAEYGVDIASSTLTAAPTLRVFDLPADLAVAGIKREWKDDLQSPLAALIALPAGPDSFATGDLAGRVSTWSADGTLDWQSSPVRDDASLALAVRYLASSRDGTRLVAVAHTTGLGGSLPYEYVDDARLAVWSLSDHSLVAPVLNTHRRIAGVALNPSSTLIAALSESGSEGHFGGRLLIHDVANDLRQLAVIPIADHGNDVLTSVWFSDDRTVGATTRFLNERQWDVGLTGLIETADARLQKMATQEAYDAALREADTASDAGDVAASVSSLKRATELRPGSAEAWARYSNWVYNPLTGEGDRDAAAAAFDRALAIDPYDVILLVNRARFNYFEGHYEDALRDYSTALTRPMDGFAIVPIVPGSLGINRGIHDLSIKLRKGARYEPAAFQAYTLVMLERWPEAASAFRQVIINYGGSARDFQFLAYALTWTEQWGAAVVAARAAIKRIEDDGYYSRLDGFTWMGDEPIERNLFICQMAHDAAGWGAPEPETKALLNKARDNCAAVVAADASFGDAATRLAQIDAALAAEPVP
jgi:tetratricopeptide (TPR) repeat protein